MIDIPNDPILGLARKVEVCSFVWSIADKELHLSTLVRFYSNGVEVVNGRVKPYAVTLIGSNTTNLGTEENPLGEYDYWVGLYGNAPVNLTEQFEDMITLRASEGRFDI